MRKVDERAQKILEWMRKASSMHDWHTTGGIHRTLGMTSSEMSPALKALHDQSLVEPGRRSMWRLSAKGRDLTEQYREFL